MATTRKSANKLPAADWRSPGSPEALNDVELCAHGIVTDRPDLMPSVSLIMNAELEPSGRLRALNLFRDSLLTRGDVHRDPRVAIASSLQA